MKGDQDDPAPSVALAALQQMGPEDLEEARQCARHYLGEWRRIARQGHAPSVAATMHRVVDERLEAFLARDPHAPDVSCRRGCAHCCRVHVAVTPQEGRLLAEHARELGLELDRGRMTRQAAAVDPEAWRDLAPEDRRCIFLAEDDSCSVYEHRPTACRKYFVVSEPALCDTVANAGGSVAILFDIETELAHGSALAALGSPGLAESVAAALDELERPRRRRRPIV